MSEIVSWLGNASYGVSGTRLKEGNPVVFRPLDISGCKIWMDGNDASTVNVSPFGKVFSWFNKGDLSGNFLDISAAAVARYGDNFVNGLNVVTFNGDAYLSGTYALNFQARSVFIVSRRNTDISGGVFTWLTSDTTGGQETGISDSSGTFTYLLARHPVFGVKIGFDTTTNTKGYAELASFVNSSTDLSANYVGLNGEPQTFSYNNLASSYNTSSIPYYLGNYFGGSTLPNDYDLCELIVYDTALNATQIALVEEYLISKWAIVSPPAPVFSPSDISGLQVWFESPDSVSLDLSGNVGSWSNKGSSGGIALPNYGTTKIVIDPDLNNQYVVDLSNADMIWNTTLNYMDRTQFVVGKVTSDLSGAAYPYCPFINSFTYNLSSGGMQTGVSWDSNTKSFQYTMCQNSFNCPLVYDTSENPLNKRFLVVFVNDSATTSNNALYYNNNSSNVNIGSNVGNLFWTSNADYYLNNANGGSNGQNQHLAEIIEYDSVLSFSNIVKVATYLSDKWGLGL